MKLRKMKRNLAEFSVIDAMGISLFSAGTDGLPVKATEPEDTVATEDVAATSEETATGGATENTTEVAIDETNFPDSIFRSYVMRFDTNKDGIFSSDELLAVKKIYVGDKKIANLKGVEYFTALEELWCHVNQLTSLDVSGNHALKKLHCGHNQLTSLNVSNNPALEDL
ncbi:MAG: hypothetical protein K2H07_01920, partial [Lachnospiraceae bacterium]|nr:hypothetical protein [Lachnospiraceae bacterium]